MNANSREMNLHLSELLQGFAQVPEELDRPVKTLVLDSRQVESGDVFVALAGTKNHGVEFADAAHEAGASLMLYEPAGAESIPEGMSALPVPDLGRRLGVIASRLHGEPSEALCVVGITGTDGKTSTAYYLAQALDDGQRECALLGTIGYGYLGEMEPASQTTPDAIALQRRLASFVKQKARYLVMEVSSHALDQNRVAGMQFDTAVLTNLSRDHLDYHGGIEAYADAKRMLFRMPGLRMAVLNVDEAFGVDLLRDSHGGVKTIAYGLYRSVAMKEADQYLWARDVRANDRGLSLALESSWGSALLHAPVLGRFNAYNLLASASVMLGMDIPLDEVIQRLSRVGNAPGRMERFGGGDVPLMVVDFAHTPAALSNALEALRLHTRESLICVFGCGGNRDVGKRAMMGEVAERLADKVFVTDDNPRNENGDAIVTDILSGMSNPEQAEVERDRGAAIERVWSEAGAGDVVLIAGKGHEDYQLVGDQRIAYSDREVVARLCGEVCE